LIKEWLEAMENGYFKFKLDSQVSSTRIIDEEGYSFVFQVKRFFFFCLAKKQNLISFIVKYKTFYREA
jgi:hypothetical protein